MDFDVLREAMEAEEPALALNAIKRRVPFESIAHARNGADDERVSALPDIPFPAWHMCGEGGASAGSPKYMALLSVVVRSAHPSAHGSNGMREPGGAPEVQPVVDVADQSFQM